MVGQRLSIQGQPGSGEHLDGQVDELQLLLGEAALYHALKDFPGEFDIVDAVLAIGCEFLRGEVLPAFARSQSHLGTLGAHTIPGSQRGK